MTNSDDGHGNDAPFPQADRLDTVIEATVGVSEGDQTYDRLACRLGLTVRNAEYYADASARLGLLERRGDRLVVTALGKRLVSSGPCGRRDIVRERVASEPVFREAVAHFLKTGEVPSVSQISMWIRAAYPTFKLSTLKRRAGTVRAWARW